MPISVNKLYVNIRGQGRRFLSSEGKEFKKKLLESYQNQAPQNISEIVSKRLLVTTKLTSNSWVLKDGITPRKKDVMNYEKVLTDQLFECLGIDDSMIWSVTLSKHLGEDAVEYTIEAI